MADCGLTAFGGRQAKAVGPHATLSGRRSVSKFRFVVLLLRCWDAAMSSTCCCGVAMCRWP